MNCFCCSHPGHPFAAGVSLEKLSAVTVDENGKETFVTGGELDQIQKVYYFSYRNGTLSIGLLRILF